MALRRLLLKILKIITGAGLWLFLGAIAIYALTGAYYSNFISDGDVMYATTVAIANHGTVVLQPNPGQPQIVAGRGGRYYSKYGLGQSLAAVPFFNLGRDNAFTYGLDYNALDVIPFFFVRFLPILATAATVWLVYLWGKLLYASVKIGIALAVLYGLGTSAWPYSRFFFSEPLFTLCILGAAFVFVLAGRTQNQWGRRGWLVGGGALLGYALLVRVSGVALLPAFVVYLWLIQKPAIEVRRPLLQFFGKSKIWGRNVNQKSKQAAVALPKNPLWQSPLKNFLLDGLAVTLGALPILLLLLWYNYVRFGSIFNNGYDGEGFTTPPWEGFYGLLFSPGKSVFLYSPILIGVIWAARGFWKRFQPEAILCGLVIATTIVYYSAWWAWWGGSSWGPRFLVPCLPFAVLALGVLLQRSRKWVGIIWLVLFPLSIFVQMLGVAPDFNVYTNAVTHGNPALDHLYIFDLDKSPLLAHLKMLRHGDLYTIRSLTPGQVGLNVDTAQYFSPTIIVLAVISAVLICYNYLVSRTQPISSKQPDLIYEPATLR